MGGRLVLAIITAPWCEKGNAIIQQASHAAALLDDFFTPTEGDSINTIFDLGLDPTIRLSKPLIGIIDSETFPPVLIESLGGVTSYPYLKCVLTYPDIGENEEKLQDESELDDGIVMWDYIGQKESANDLYESVLMYWYRFVLSNALERHPSTVTSRSPIFSFGTIDALHNFLGRHGDKLLRPAHARFRHERTNSLLHQVFDFFMGGKHRGISGVLNNSLEFDDGNINQQCAKGTREGCIGDFESTQEIDPYILFIQCRSGVQKDLSESGLEAEHEFNEFAEEMSHRKDVAFFTLMSEPLCNEWRARSESHGNGAVVIFRVRRFISYSNTFVEKEPTLSSFENNPTRLIRSITTNWSEALQLPPHAIYDPPTGASVSGPSDGKRMNIKLNIVDDPSDASQYVRSKMVPFVITQTTPTVLWFERHRAAQLAFAWYRKVHAVLVVDIGLSHQQQTDSVIPSDSSWSDETMIEEPVWPSKLNRSLATAQLLSSQRKAIQSFYNAALNHRNKRPYDDVIFLIVPSSETRILTKFGIDIWSPLDEAIFSQNGAADDEGFEQSNNAGYCSSGMPSSNVLPMMILTDSSGRSGKQPGRYYLCSNEILAASSTPSKYGGLVTEFLESFFDGTIEDPFIRSESLRPYNALWQNNRNQANVTILTGNRFESLVMEREESHSMLLFQTITCGHCKRFSVLWNEFSSLVQAMNWGGVIDVMKVDVSKNDIRHDQIDVWDVPSVYYFPANEKDNPIEVTWIGPKSNPQHDYDEGLSWIRSGLDLVEWIIRQGKLDVKLLVSLDESKNKPSS